MLRASGTSKQDLAFPLQSQIVEVAEEDKYSRLVEKHPELMVKNKGFKQKMLNMEKKMLNMEETIVKMVEENNLTNVFLEDRYELVVCAFLDNMLEELYETLHVQESAEEMAHWLRSPTAEHEVSKYDCRFLAFSEFRVNFGLGAFLTFETGKGNFFDLKFRNMS